MMKLNSIGESFVRNPRRNYQGIINQGFYKELILLYLITNEEYNPKKFKEYVKSLSILELADKDKHSSGSVIWKHYIDAAKDRLLKNDGFIKESSYRHYIISEYKREVIIEKYSKYIEDNVVLREIDKTINLLENSPQIQEQFNLLNLKDARERILSSIVQRRGQKDFRQELLQAYEFKCAISECDVPQALEASHIIPYLGRKTNKIQNGILLRGDIHTLFDLRLISIDKKNYKVLISPILKNTYYSQFEEKLIKLPSKKEHYPSKEAFQKHRIESNL